MLIVKLLIFQPYFFFKITGSFCSLLSRWNHPLSMIYSKFFSLFEKYFFHACLINGTMSHRWNSVLSNACLCLKCKRSSFSMVVAIFQHPFWLQLYHTCQKSVVLGVPGVKIHFLFSSGVEELMYSRIFNRSLIPWPSNNPKEVGPSWCCSNTLNWFNYLSSSVSISDLIDTLGHIHIKPGIYFPLNLHTGNPGISLPSPMFSSTVLLESYEIFAR